MEQHTELWAEFESKAEYLLPHAKGYLKKLKSRFDKDTTTGCLVYQFTSNSTPLYEKALTLLTTELKLLDCRKKLEWLEARYKLTEKEFWIEAEKETGADVNSENLKFHPLEGTIRRKEKVKKPAKYNSYADTIEDYSQLVKEALSEPLKAARMAHDVVLPKWLKELARTLVSGNLKPQLRSLIDQCVQEPSIARQCCEISDESEMPEWFADLCHILGEKGKQS